MICFCWLCGRVIYIVIFITSGPCYWSCCIGLNYINAHLKQLHSEFFFSWLNYVLLIYFLFLLTNTCTHASWLNKVDKTNNTDATYCKGTNVRVKWSNSFGLAPAVITHSSKTCIKMSCFVRPTVPKDIQFMTQKRSKSAYRTSWKWRISAWKNVNIIMIYQSFKLYFLNGMWWRQWAVWWLPLTWFNYHKMILLKADKSQHWFNNKKDL